MTKPQSDKQKGETRPEKRRLSLAGWVLVGLGLGIVAGVFFGDMVGWLKLVGDIFIRLLQITVIPFVSVSLITALGAMEYDGVKRLALKGGAIVLALWAITVVVILLMPLSFPTWPSASFFSTSLVEEPANPDYLRLFIPSNPFHSYANALVPAVVVFSILIGLGLIGMPGKAAVLEPLEVIRDALVWVTGVISKLAPIGVFALIASAAGTTDGADIARMQVYIVLYALIALFLGLWVVPGLVTTLTPLRHVDVVRALRTPLITAFATGSSLIVLPMLIEKCNRLIADTKMFGEEDQERAEASVKALIPTSFTFPSITALLALSFILFAGWYIGAEVSAESYPGLIFAGIPSLFGGTLLTIPMLLDLVGLPHDLFRVFVSADVINARFGTFLSAMYYAAVGLLGSIALTGRVRVRRIPLIRFAAISTMLLATGLVGVRIFYTHVVVVPYTKDDAMKRLTLRSTPQPAIVHTDEADPGTRLGRGPASLEEIRDRGVLRVGYIRRMYPSAFFNTAEPSEFVGFDVEMAHSLARRLELSIEFVPIANQEDAAPRLAAGDCDIVMGPMLIGVDSSQRFSMSAPVLESSACVIVLDRRRREFRSWNDARRQGADLRVLVPPNPDAMHLARSLLPEATLAPGVPGMDVNPLLESVASGVDAVLHSSEHGAAWTLLYPEFSVAVPRPVAFISLGYAVARGNDELLATVNAWLGEEKTRGTVDGLYRYWMLGQVSRADRPPRWSVIRDVLGWVD
jgi:Na+/H+-dicarboxylate symporter/ABC-type amino acid transport substrate-binding protein